MSLINRICEQFRFQHHLPEGMVRHAVACAVFTPNGHGSPMAALQRGKISLKPLHVKPLDLTRTVVDFAAKTAKGQKTPKNQHRAEAECAQRR
jgi:hypothetical protein